MIIKSCFLIWEDSPNTCLSPPLCVSSVTADPISLHSLPECGLEWPWGPLNIVCESSTFPKIMHTGLLENIEDLRKKETKASEMAQGAKYLHCRRPELNSGTVLVVLYLRLQLF